MLKPTNDVTNEVRDAIFNVHKQYSLTVINRVLVLKQVTNNYVEKLSVSSDVQILCDSHFAHWKFAYLPFKHLRLVSDLSHVLVGVFAD